MKTKALPKNVIFSILAIGACVAAIYAGLETFSRYPETVQGIQGLATFYLLYQLYASPKSFIKEPVGVQLEFPRVIKHIIPIFLGCIIASWSAQYIFDAALYFLKLLNHN